MGGVGVDADPDAIVDADRRTEPEATGVGAGTDTGTDADPEAIVEPEATGVGAGMGTGTEAEPDGMVEPDATGVGAGRGTDAEPGGIMDADPVADVAVAAKSVAPFRLRYRTPSSPLVCFFQSRSFFSRLKASAEMAMTVMVIIALASIIVAQLDKLILNSQNV